MLVPDAKVIVNPAAGNFSIFRKWPWLNRKLRDTGIKFDYKFTEERGHAIELAKVAADNGYQYIIAIGGDGTVSEVANGIINSTNAHSTMLGIVNVGTTCTFARSIGIPRDINKSILILTGQGRMLVDVGAIECISNGQSLRRFFINQAEVGFGAAVVEAQEHMDKYFTPNFISPTLKYIPRIIGGFQAYFRYRHKHISMKLNNKKLEVANCLMVVVANGCHLGGGMLIAPQARIDDGLLDIITFGDIGKLEIWKLWRKTYNGSHITNPKIMTNAVSAMKIQSSEKVLVEADGELIGECPASFWVLPSVLTIVV